MIEGHKAPARRRRDRGMSLLELMVVLAIIAMVAAFAAPQVVGYLDRSRAEAASIQIKSLRAILEMYRLDVGRFPNDEEGLDALLVRPTGVDAWRGPYVTLPESLIDPWGRPYGYRLADDGVGPVVISFGADGVEGGDGPAADVVR